MRLRREYSKAVKMSTKYVMSRRFPHNVYMYLKLVFIMESLDEEGLVVFKVLEAEYYDSKANLFCWRLCHISIRELSILCLLLFLKNVLAIRIGNLPKHNAHLFTTNTECPTHLFRQPPILTA